MSNQQPFMCIAGTIDSPGGTGTTGRVTFTPTNVVNPDNHSESWDRKATVDHKPLDIDVKDPQLLRQFAQSKDAVLYLGAQELPASRR